MPFKISNAMLDVICYLFIYILLNQRVPQAIELLYSEGIHFVRFSQCQWPSMS